jgi:hypothetical protein
MRDASGRLACQQQLQLGNILQKCGSAKMLSRTRVVSKRVMLLLPVPDRAHPEVQASASPLRVQAETSPMRGYRSCSSPFPIGNTPIRPFSGQELNTLNNHHRTCFVRDHEMLNQTASINVKSVKHRTS